MESNAKAYSTVRLILFLNISLSKRVTFAQVSEGKRLIGSEAPTPLLNFFAEDLPQSWTLALPIEIGFKRAVVVVYQGKGIFLNIEANKFVKHWAWLWHCVARDGGLTGLMECKLT